VQKRLDRAMSQGRGWLADEARNLLWDHHPVELRAEGTLTAWGQLFADYEILQPIEQLARELEVDASLTERVAALMGHHVQSRKVLGGLEGRGWRRKGHVSGFTRTFDHGGGAQVEIHLKRGIDISNLQSDQTSLAEVVCTPDPQRRGDPGPAALLHRTLKGAEYRSTGRAYSKASHSPYSAAKASIVMFHE
jgi:hypothetical protein